MEVEGDRHAFGNFALFAWVYEEFAPFVDLLHNDLLLSHGDVGFIGLLDELEKASEDGGTALDFRGKNCVFVDELDENFEGFEA